jgi:DNA polymerase
MKPGPKEAELLQYLADLGWSDLYLRPGSRASSDAQAPEAVPSGEKAKASSKGAASGAPVGPARTEIEAARSAASPDGGSYGSSGSSTPREIGPAAAARRPLVEVVAALDSLAAVVAACRECKLCTTRNLTVFASGDPQARLMLVGEGPGAEEDKQGLPFVGAAGELLNKILAAIGLARDQVYVANIVKCRPPGNRDPEPDEVRACFGYLEKQIELVQPAVLVALGRYAAQTLLGTDASLTRLRGEWHDLHGIPLRVTYHPAALLRNAAWKRPTWEDMQLVRDRLNATDPQATDLQAPDPQVPDPKEGD